MTYRLLQPPSGVIPKPLQESRFLFHWGIKGTESESSAQAAGPLPWQRAGFRRLPAIPEVPAPHHCSALSLHVNTALIAVSLTLRAPPPSLGSNRLLSTNHFCYLRYP